MTQNKTMQHQNKSQLVMVLEHLNIMPITPIEALNLYGCFRLSAIIYKIKKMGYKIHTELVVKDRKNFAKYSLERN